MTDIDIELDLSDEIWYEAELMIKKYNFSSLDELINRIIKDELAIRFGAKK